MTIRSLLSAALLPLLTAAPMHADDSVPSVRKVRPAVPRSVARVVDRALATDPGDRFQSAREFAKPI